MDTNKDLPARPDSIAAGSGPQDPKEQCDLGYKCEVEEQDPEQAAYWYGQAAAQGYDDAQYKLGNCYYCGQGVEQDYAKAAYWFEKAAAQGHADARYRLALCYDYGRGVELDPAKALRGMRQAAEAGSAAAQFNLGARYAKGKGVEKDLRQAVSWLEKAAAQGDRDAIAQVKLLRPRLEAEQKPKAAAPPAASSASTEEYAADDISFEIVGLIAAAVFVGLSLVFRNLGGEVHAHGLFGGLKDVALNLVCIVGLFVSGAAALAGVASSLLDLPLVGGLLGAAGALVVITSIAEYPVVMRWVFYVVAGVVALLILRMIMKKSRK
ncbi:MAG: sel1 repeat family protein [Firmicutes bacterium]|nr:sel1 repeat family protein [Bacillota bacterium]